VTAGVAALASPPRNAFAWSVAADLVRRHPALRIHEDHADENDVLHLTRPTGAVHVFLFRVGETTALVRNGGGKYFDLWPWEQALELPPEQVIREIEQAAGLGSPPQPATATPRSLVYRMVASVALTTMRSRHPLRAHDGWHDRPALDPIPLLMEHNPDVRLSAMVMGRYWLLRDGQAAAPVAMLDTEGYAYVGHNLHHLPTAYAAHGRNLHRTTAAVLGDVL
jgi:hypothetical protein